MNSRRVPTSVAILVALALSAAPAYTRGRGESPDSRPSYSDRRPAVEREVSGLPDTGEPGRDAVFLARVVFVGNEPFARPILRLADGSGEYAITSRETERRVGALSGRLAEFRVRVVDEPSGDARLVVVLGWKVVE